MHLQPVFEVDRTESDAANHKSEKMSGKKFEARLMGGNVSKDLFLRELCLPSGTQRSDADLEQVVNLLSFYDCEHDRVKGGNVGIR